MTDAAARPANDAPYQLLPPLTESDYAALKESIAEHGILVPVDLDEHGDILDGHNRVQIWNELRAEGIVVGDYPRIVRFGMTEDEKRDHVLTLNLYRRHLSQAARGELIRELRARGMTLQAIAEKAGVGVGTVHRDLAVSNSAFPSGKADRTLGADGKSYPSRYRPRAALAKSARDAADAITAGAVLGADAIPEGVSYVPAVRGLARNAERQIHADEIAAEPPPLPTGPFRVIVADPPWTYASRSADPTHRARNPYPDMSLEAICALPVGDLAADDCILWLWTTNAHMRAAYEVLDAWGFTPKTILTWVKDRMGTGDWLRGKTEHCLVAVRGRPTVLLTNQTTVLYGPMREHSRKPDEFYALVEGLCPGSKVELFSRLAREGWVAHGSEVAA